MVVNEKVMMMIWN